MNLELYEKLTRLQWLLHKRQVRGYSSHGPLADTARGQGRLLSALRQRDGLSTKELSAQLDIGISTLNELLAKLEKHGYVERAPHEGDRRVSLVMLTDKGREQERGEQGEPVDIFADLSEDEQKLFESCIDRVNACLEKNAGDCHRPCDGSRHGRHAHGGYGGGPRRGHGRPAREETDGDSVPGGGENGL